MQVKNSIIQAVCRSHFSVWWVAGMEGACHLGTGEVQEGSGVRYVCFMAAALSIHIRPLSILLRLEME